MKVALERLDVRGLELALDDGLVLRLARAEKLRGRLETGPKATGAADVVELQPFALRLGTLLLESVTGLLVEALSFSMQTAPHLALEASADLATTRALSITVGDVVIRGAPLLEGVRLSVRGHEGNLAAEKVAIEGFELSIGDVHVSAPLLAAQAVELAWGNGFRLGARKVTSPATTVTTGSLRVAATDLAVTDVSFHDGVSVDRATVGGADVDVTLAPASRERGSTSSFDWVILDYLSGDLDVDVAVELSVPILGTRKATHRLRVPITDGIIDYRALERNLANLENALLDFSVRDGGLALERVNPLFPVRGHGKPIVVWRLGPEDRALAEREHVRLAVLPTYELAAAPPTSSDPPAIALHRLDLLDIAARLELAPVEAPLLGAVRPRHIERLEVRGDLHSSHPGTLAADVTGIALGVHDLAGISIDTVTAAAIKPIAIVFDALRPAEVHLAVAQLTIDTLKKTR